MELGEPASSCRPSAAHSPPQRGARHLLTRSPSAHRLTRLPFHLADVASGCMLVLMLMTTGLTSTGAVPAPTPLRTLQGARGCHMAQFKSLSPQELKAFKRAKDALVSVPTC